MQLIIRRGEDEKWGEKGPRYNLFLQLEPTPEEEQLIDRNNLLDYALYELDTTQGIPSDMGEILNAITIDIKKLIDGLQIQTSNIYRLIEIEAEVRKSLKNIKATLILLMQYAETEEVIEI